MKYTETENPAKFNVIAYPSLIKAKKVKIFLEIIDKEISMTGYVFVAFVTKGDKVRITIFVQCTAPFNLGSQTRGFFVRNGM